MSSITLIDWRSDIPDIAYQDDVRTFIDNLEDFIRNSDYGLVANGTANVWDGSFGSGVYLDTIRDFYDLIRGCELVVTVENNRLFVECIHHDGCNSYEIRQVTKRGYDRTDAWRSYGLTKVDLAEWLSTSRYYTRNCFKNNRELNSLCDCL